MATKKTAKTPDESAPLVTLPRSVGDRRIPDHPLLIARRRVSRTELARAMGVTSQAVVVWEYRCRGDRDYRLPAHRIKAIAVAADLPPWALRPDVFERNWAYSKDVLGDLTDFIGKLVEPVRGGLVGVRK